MRIALLLSLICLAPGCVLIRSPHPEGPRSRRDPIESSRRAMTRDEAVSLGLGQCRSRGYRCELKEAHRTGKDVWKVKFHAFDRDAKGHLHLEYDAWSRALLKVDEKVKARKKDKDWDDDRDDDRGHGRGKKKGRGNKDD